MGTGTGSGFWPPAWSSGRLFLERSDARTGPRHGRPPSGRMDWRPATRRPADRRPSGGRADDPRTSPVARRTAAGRHGTLSPSPAPRTPGSPRAAEHPIGLEPGPHLHRVDREGAPQSDQRQGRLAPEGVEPTDVVVEQQVVRTELGGPGVGSLRLLVEPLLRVRDAEVEPGVEEVGREPRHLLELADGGPVLPLVHEQRGQLMARQRVLRGLIDRDPERGERLLDVPLVGQGEAEVELGIGEGRIRGSARSGRTRCARSVACAERKAARLKWTVALSGSSRRAIRCSPSASRSFFWSA